ncbi:MAG TPA: phenylalanine--tRNA ligase subunit beta [Candidatus Sumerlaeota bacterium]|nr:phenylalanine--tRNA ligase subunit beta [Candidatus Sumerlaeota bacterium]
MKISVRWLRQFLNVELSIAELKETMEMAGHEVEGAWDLGLESGKLVVARVLDVQPHPNADRLRVCQVDAGTGQPLSVVCGAPNVTAGMNVVCALPGARLPDGNTIKKSKIRGQLSEGMLCSARELEMGTDHSGIMPLPEDLEIGQPYDYIIDIKVTPNRPDCLSILGMARDIGAALGKKVFPPTPRFKETLEHIDSFVRLSVKDRGACPRYTCRLIRGVKVGESPLWLKRALEACGMRSINNVVDVTNYVLMELGHPLHAFDFDRLHNSEIQVRRAEACERLVLIDDREITLDPEDLVIADADRPLALAGVMGGRDSEVGPGTTTILLESAYFDPATIRRTARKYNFQTESSYRFERGTDRARLTLSLNRATQLIHELAGGEVIKNMLDAQTTITDPGPIVLDVRRVNRILGLELTSTEIADYLVNLGCEIRRGDKESLVVSIPSHRVDISRDIDLIEEVARLHNYNEIPATMPKLIPTIRPCDRLGELATRLSDQLVALGFCEVLQFSFISEADAAAGGFNIERLPRLANPLTVDQALMRPSLATGLLRVIAANQKVGEASQLLFEIGKAWREDARAADPAGERHELALAAAGPVPTHWGAPAREYDFYDLKGVVENLFSWINGPAPSFARDAGNPLLHPGRSARIEWDGRPVGVLGQVHPRAVAQFDLRGDAVLALIDLSLLVSLLGESVVQFKPIPKFPGSLRDLALVVDEQLPAAEILSLIHEAGRPLVDEVQVFDLYSGSHVPAGKKSLALRLRLLSPEKTLTEQEITETIERIVRRLEQQFGATLRT